MTARISPARRSFLSRRSTTKEDSVGGCSMRITEDVRRYAAEKGLSDEAAIKEGLEEKAAELAKAGEVYQKV